jgi:hypothetical protein
MLCLTLVQMHKVILNKPSAKPHFLYFRHLNIYQLYYHILKPNYILNTALFMQLSSLHPASQSRHLSKSSWI